MTNSLSGILQKSLDSVTQKMEGELSKLSILRKRSTLCIAGNSIVFTEVA